MSAEDDAWHAQQEVFGLLDDVRALCARVAELEDDNRWLRKALNEQTQGPRVAELTEGLERLCDWCTRYDILRDEVVRARMILAGKEKE